MLKLIDTIYATALDSNNWPQLLLQLDQYLKTDTTNEDGDGLTNSSSLLNVHFERAVSLADKYSKVDERSELLQSSLEQLPVALFQIQNVRSLLPLNQRATQLLPELKKKLSLHEEHFPPQIRIVDDDFILLEFSSEKGQRLLLVSPSPAHEINHDLLFLHWKISKKESLLCDQLLAGLSLKAIAEQNNRSIHTIRNQLKAVLKKSGCNTQAALIRKLLTPPAESLEVVNCDGAKNQAPKTLLLDDGRTLCWEEHGDPDGVPVILCHTIFQSRYCRHPDEGIVEKAGIRIICPDRPGFGQSDPCVHSNILHWHNDLLALIDYLQLESVALLGLGEGAIFALVAAEKLSTRITQVVCVNTPLFAHHPADFSGMPLLPKIGCQLAHRTPVLLQHMINLIGGDEILKKPGQYIAKLYPGTSEKDRQAYADKALQEVLVKDFKESNRQGWGLALSLELQGLMRLKQRAFNPDNIRCPVFCWHSQVSKTPPVDQIKALVTQLPNGVLHLIDDGSDFIIYHAWSKCVYTAAYG